MGITPEELAAIREQKFTIEGNDLLNPTVLMITIPIARCAADIEEGKGLMLGMIDEAKRICVRKLGDVRSKMQAKKPGIIGPDGKPMGGLSVN